MTGRKSRALAFVLMAGMAFSLCGCTANRSQDEGASVNDVSEKDKIEKVMDRKLFCTAENMYYISENEDRIVQRSFTGNQTKEYKVKKSYTELISVEEDWIYYYCDSDVFRMPIVHEDGSDRLDPDQAERLLRAGKNKTPTSVLPMDSGLIYQWEWEDEIRFYDFESKKIRVCMKEILSDPDDYADVDLIAAHGNYVVITAEFYDNKASSGSVYRTYRYDVRRDQAELLADSCVLRGQSDREVLLGENLIAETWEDDDRYISYDMNRNTVKTLLTDEQVYQLFQRDVKPEVKKNQIDFLFLGSAHSDDGQRVYIECEVMWHKGTTYHLQNFVVSILRKDGSIRYEDKLSEAMERAVKPRKLLWTNNHEVKKDCLFYAHEICVEEIWDGICLLSACSKEKGKEKVSLFCYDLKKQQMRELTKGDRETFYSTLLYGAVNNLLWEEAYCLESWPNRMAYKELDD